MAAEQLTDEHELLLEQLETLIQSSLPAGEKVPAVEFLRAYYGSASPELLSSRHPPELLQRGLAHFELMRQARAQGPVVEVQVLPDAAGCLLRCVAGDMPFLVDTLLIAIRQSGAVVRWLVHPVIGVQRAADGAYLAVSDADDAQAESLVQIEFGGVDEAQAQNLVERTRHVLGDLGAVVGDYPAIRERLAEQSRMLQQDVPGIDAEERAEIAAFLQWLDEDHFTFLGYVESQTGEGEGVVIDPETGLGLWRAEQENPITVAPASEMQKYAQSRRPLIITTTEGRSPIHHDEYCDVVVVKQYDKEGLPQGTVRFLGLFSSEVYNTLPRRIPLVRRKIEQVMLRSGLRSGGHAGKQLRDILDNLPRNELFQSSVSELLALAMGVRTVREAQQLRLFVRRDRYGRFYSCLIYQHRDRYSSSARRAMSQCMLRLLGGIEVEHEVSFQRDGLARLHLTVRTPPGTQTPLTVAELEARLQEVATRWEDSVAQALHKLLPDAQAEDLVRQWLGRIPVSFREEVSPMEAATDLQYLNMARADNGIRVRLALQGEDLELKLYGCGQMPSLSLILPRLEHFGLRVLAQHPYAIGEGADAGWIQHFDLSLDTPAPPDRERRAAFEEAFIAAWQGRLETDGLNALVLHSGLSRREVALTRALVKYAQQTGLPFSQGYIESMLLDHAEFIAELCEMFEQRFHPEGAGDTGAIESALRERLEQVASLDADRLLACMLSVVRATLRTNFYQRDADGDERSYISLKIRSCEVPELPKPHPMVETFVYSPEVEGIHLRGGPVARGGLRWSDRREDFRTEVLGLVKAQMVKNAVIVPMGAKGGFVVKKPVDKSDRAAWQQAGVDCYKTFISALLEITDNLVDGDIVPPPQVRRHDDDDPYLVVAADKGTATFSDIANEISLGHEFWLGDAFASGGSDGYDHKKMGITARGAWESVKRHFRELGHDCQAEDFTVAGVGDMAGDVFGNGMLLSRHIRLVAAFNHMHIFIDPNPDAARSFEERQRLFELPRSSWLDYDAELISEGGGIYERSAKSIALSPQARAALGIEAESLSPTNLIHHILQAPLDLFWNGGIGTYVKGSAESHAEVGDRANDSLRINAKQLRVRVVGEGGNLGLTQRARIEAAKNGCRVITDFNDNAGGVNSSDREVNLKIPLNAEVQTGAMELPARNRLLESMTEELAAKVLRDSDLQTQCICMLARVAPARLDEHAQLIRMLERSGQLDRAIEFLPDEENIAERRSAGQGLTMPELAVLVSYSKMDLFDAVVDSALPKDPMLESVLLDYFPAPAREGHEQALSAHRLRSEIIATVTTNQMVNRMGVSFARRVADENQRPMVDVVHAWLAASLIVGAEQRCEALEQSAAPVDVIYGALERLSGLLKHLTLWLLAEHQELPDLQTLVARYAEAMQQLEQHLDGVLVATYQDRHQAHRAGMVERAMEDNLAVRHANHHVLGSGFDIAALSQQLDLDLVAVATVYFDLGNTMNMPWLLEQINALRVQNRWQAMARNQLREEAFMVHRQLCAKVLQSAGSKEPAAALEDWREAHSAAREHVMHSLAELKTLETPDAAGVTVILGQFRRLMA